MPSHTERWIHFFNVLVDGRIGLAKTVRPKHLPCEKFRVAQHKPPKLDVVAIDWPLPFTACIHELCQFEKCFFCTLRTDAALPRLCLTVIAKATHLAGIR